MTEDKKKSPNNWTIYGGSGNIIAESDQNQIKFSETITGGSGKIISKREVK